MRNEPLDIEEYVGPRSDAAMSFEEIAQALGITRSCAWDAYQSAMRKLQRMRGKRQLQDMRELVIFKENL